MMAIRALVWLGTAGWIVCALDFGVSALLRALTPRGRLLGGIRLRFTWAAAAVGSACYLLSRLGALDRGNLPLPYLARISLDVGLSLAGVVCGVALLVTLARRGWKVLQ